MEKAREKPKEAPLPPPLLSQEQEQQFRRDLEELEGTLLLPTAQPVSTDNVESVTNAPIMADTTVATAVPVARFEYDAVNEDDDNLNKEEDPNDPNTRIQEVPVIPSLHNGLDPERERDLLVHGERKGLILAEQEKEDIQKASRETRFAKNYHARQEIKEGNARAAFKKYQEDQGLTQTSATIPKEEYQPPAEQPKAPEFYEGTYGKEYEIAEYETKDDYETAEYEATEYKSVYDP